MRSIARPKGFRKQTAGKPPRLKKQMVYERDYYNKLLLSEDLIEFDYQPHKAKKFYSVIVLRKFISEAPGRLTTGWDFRYFFYVTKVELELEWSVEIKCISGRS